MARTRARRRRRAAARPSGSARSPVEPNAVVARRTARPTGCGLGREVARAPAGARRPARAAAPKTWSLPVQIGSAAPCDVDRAASRGARRSAAAGPAHSRPSTVAGSWRRSAASQSIGGPVHPAVVVAPCAGRRAYARVVEQPELVAHVDQRQPAVGEGDRVQQQDAPHARARPRARRRARAPPPARPATRQCRWCAPRRCAGRAGSARRARTSPGTRRRRSRPGSAGAGDASSPTRRGVLGR